MSDGRVTAEMVQQSVGKFGADLPWCRMVSNSLNGLLAVSDPEPQPLLNVPEQYKQRASYDFIGEHFKVCAGGYGLAECEDSEVAHAFCMLWNAALASTSEAKGSDWTEHHLHVKPSENCHLCKR